VIRILTKILLAAVVCIAIRPVHAGDWPQWLGPERDGVWRETGLAAKFPGGGPKVLWRVPLGSGYAGPAVAGDRVYVMDRRRAIDARGKPVPAERGVIPGDERVLCVDIKGQKIWEHRYDCPYALSYPSGPRTTPLIRDGWVYVLGAMGDLKCLDARTGQVRWAKNLPRDYGTQPPIWGYAASLLLDGQMLYTLAGGKGSAVVALDKDTGKEKWRALTSEEVCYCPPMIYTLAGRRQLLIWLSESLNGLDPASGKVLWSLPYPAQGKPKRPAVNISTPRVLDNRIFLTNAYHGPMMVQLEPAGFKPAIVWKGRSNRLDQPDRLHSIMATPFIKDGLIYGVSLDGNLVCLDADTGKLRWQTYAATGKQAADCATAFLIRHEDRFVLFNDQGELILAYLRPEGYEEIDRARILTPDHSARGRKVVWSYPAFAHRCVLARNDHEMVCVSLAAEGTGPR
jgi:outer membrane protein assembly factor BamB